MIYDQSVTRCACCHCNVRNVFDTSFVCACEWRAWDYSDSATHLCSAHPSLWRRQIARIAEWLRQSSNKKVRNT